MSYIEQKALREKEEAEAERLRLEAVAREIAEAEAAAMEAAKSADIEAAKEAGAKARVEEVASAENAGDKAEKAKPVPVPRRRNSIPAPQSKPESSVLDTADDLLSLTENHRAVYESMWNQVSKGSDTIDACTAVTFFKPSGLGSKRLRAIWDASDSGDPPGVLSKSEFFVALKLIALQQAGLDAGLESLNISAPLPSVGPDAEKSGAIVTNELEFPWLDVGATQKQCHLGVLSCGSGSYIVRKRDSSTYILSVNNDGSVVEVPIRFGIKEGSKCYMIGGSTHASLQDAVSSLIADSEAAFASGKPFEVGKNIINVVIASPASIVGNAEADAAFDSAWEEFEKSQQSTRRKSVYTMGGKDHEPITIGQASTETIKDTLKTETPAERLERVMREAEARINSAQTEHLALVEEYMKTKMSEEVLGKGIRSESKQKYDRKALSKLLKTMTKETSVYAQGVMTATITEKESKKVFLAIDAGEDIDILECPESPKVKSPVYMPN